MGIQKKLIICNINPNVFRKQKLLRKKQNKMRTKLSVDLLDVKKESLALSNIILIKMLSKRMPWISIGQF
jgi:hypothetical protein